MKNILVLGTGLVSRPGVNYLLNQSDFCVTVASNEFEKARQLVDSFPNGKAVFLDVTDSNALSDIIKKNDIVVSLLPWIYHPIVAAACVENNKNMVTTSYVSEGMRNLQPEILRKGLTFINEAGLDPGLDHMSAMAVINKVHSEGGKILKFYSYCGGLPSPDNNDNPFGYKFSWSPRGVVLASRNSARYIEDGAIVNIAGKDLFLNYECEEIDGLGTYEVYPNRDSVPYKEIYGLADAVTVKRGTYRNQGWCDTFKKIVDLGLIDETPRDSLKEMSYKQMLLHLHKTPEVNNIRNKVAEVLHLENDSAILDRFEWLGLFSDEKITDQNNYLDVLCDKLQQKLVYKEGEKDMVILRHRFLIENKDGSNDIITSTLIDFGVPYGDTSMARTVSLPMAITVKLLANGEINKTGILIPTLKEIYEPVLSELEKFSIQPIEKKWRV